MITSAANYEKHIKQLVEKPVPNDISELEEVSQEEQIPPIVPVLERRNKNKDKKYKNYSDIYAKKDESKKK